MNNNFNIITNKLLKQYFSTSLSSFNTNNPTTPTTSTPSSSSTNNTTQTQQENPTNTTIEETIIEEKPWKKKLKRIALLTGIPLALLIGLLIFGLYQVIIETQNLGIYTEMIETLYLNFDPAVISNAYFSLENAFKLLDEKQFSEEELNELKLIFGDENIKNLKLLSPNVAEQIVHRFYLLCKEKKSLFGFNWFKKQSRIYYFFPVVNVETGAVAVMKVTLLLDERHVAEIYRTREKTKKENEEKKKKLNEEKRRTRMEKEEKEKLKKSKGEAFNEEEYEKELQRKREEDKKKEEEEERKKKEKASLVEEKPIEIPPIELETIHICDAAPFAEQFEQNFFSQDDNHHLYGKKDLVYNWPFGASYLNGRSEILLYRNQNLPQLVPYLTKLLPPQNVPSVATRTGYFYYDSITNERIKLERRQPPTMF
ncbi:hypothetical protein ABK040_002957 [Willaertia magna]